MINTYFYSEELAENSDDPLPTNIQYRMGMDRIRLTHSRINRAGNEVITKLTLSRLLKDNKEVKLI